MYQSSALVFLDGWSWQEVVLELLEKDMDKQTAKRETFVLAGRLPGAQYLCILLQEGTLGFEHGS